MQDKEFWLSIQTDAHIESREYCRTFSMLSIPSSDLVSERLRIEGYAPFRRLDWGGLIARCNQIISRLYTLNVPVVFAFLYDEFWELFVKMRPAILQAFGGEYYMLPQFWAWYVDPSKGAAGWPPHRDSGKASLFADGKPKSLSVWLALSRATPENGCMYIVPANRDLTYNTDKEGEYNGFRYVDARALPAEPGDFFIWNQAVMHWGSQSTPFAEGPRLSTSMEFIKKGEKPLRADLALIHPKSVLSFKNRLYLCSELFLQYKHMHKREGIFLDFAQQVVAQNKP